MGPPSRLSHALGAWPPSPLCEHCQHRVNIGEQADPHWFEPFFTLGQPGYQLGAQRFEAGAQDLELLIIDGLNGG